MKQPRGPKTAGLPHWGKKGSDANRTLTGRCYSMSNSPAFTPATNATHSSRLKACQVNGTRE